ncbi:MAG: rhomboid family intramembrane serine protease [Thermodesulfobacteriota bacterium]
MPMIPLRDNIGSQHYSVVNTAIIAVNVLVYFHQTTLPPAVEARFLSLYGLIPAYFTSTDLPLHMDFAHKAFSFVSFQFLHAGFWHLLGNMWFLAIFGDNVEDHLGHAPYLFFYLLCGFASGGTHLLFHPDSTIPTIGASGAIAGIMGAYFFLHPTARIVTLIFLIYIVELPAFLFLGLWFILQLAYAIVTHGQSMTIAWWAHVGGFVAGALLILLAPRLPQAEIGRKLKTLTQKRGTPRLAVLTPTGPRGDPNVYGELAVSRDEAARGTRKLISLPLGMARGVYSVRIPPGLSQGSTLRLAGLGRSAGGGGRGDLLLRIRITY